MDSDLAYLIGAAGDASVIYNKKRAEYYVEYWQKNYRWLEQSIAPRIKRVFNKSVKAFPKKRGLFLMRFYSKNAYGLFKKYLDNPKLILKETKETQLEYICGFFDAEGSAPKRKPGTGYRLHIYQKDLRPLKVISKILSENGIAVGNLTHSRDIGLLPIRGKVNISNFKDCIQPEHPDKLSALQNLGI
jgi:intein-encoded DNA endonuclease-like protein